MSSTKRHSQIKCGYCGWILWSADIKVHRCFMNYDEHQDVIVIDDNGIVTMKTIERTDLINLANNDETQPPSSSDIEDELLIDTVAERRPLWDHTIDVTERTRLKKSALWSEVSNVMGGNRSPQQLKKRWQYLRDCYMKSKKKNNILCPQWIWGIRKPVSKEYIQIFRTDEISTMCSPHTRVIIYNTVSSLSGTVRPDMASEGIMIHDPGHSAAISIPDSDFLGADETNDSYSVSPNDSASQLLHRSSSSSGPSSGGKASKTRKRTADATELEEEFLKYLKEAQPKADAVDGFLEQLGEILRRLPYIRRRNLQLKFLTLAAEEEDKLTV